MELSKRIVDHLRRTGFADLPARTAEVAKQSLLDAVGVTFAASSLGEACAPFAAIARQAAEARGASVLGFGFRAAPAMAAFANGSMAHSLDYEDTFDPALVHPNAAVVPAALALAETTPGVSGGDLITAIALGADLTCRLGMAIDGRERKGFGVRSLCGTFGAVAASGKLLGLDEEQFLHAFALSMFQSAFSSEAMTYPSSHMRAVREAFAAKAGVLAAQLAAQGVRAFDQPFEGKYGLFGLYTEGGIDEERLVEGLGQRFEGDNVSFKPWPSCRGTHSFIEAALGLSRENAIEADQVAAAHVVISPFFKALCTPPERKRRPKTAIDAKFSVPFTLATALIDHDVTLESFAPARMGDATILAMADRIDHEVDERIPTHDANRGVLTLRLKDGRAFTRSIVNPLGHPDNPMSASAMADKFAACAAHARVALPPGRAERMSRAIAGLESVNDVAGLFA